MLADAAHQVVAILMAGTALIFLFSDRGNPGSRMLACCLIAAAVATGLGAPEELSAATIAATSVQQLAETLALLFGVEWGRRISLEAQSRSRRVRAAGWLFRAAQVILLVYGGLGLGYILIWPEYAVIDPTGLVKVRAVEFAVFAPLLGTTMLLAGIALGLLMLAPLDPVERIRFRSLLLAGPLFLLTMLVHEDIEPLFTALGLLIFLSGSVRYLIVQSQRAASMRQFVSPEVTRMLHRQGMAQALRRERRTISALACDLRGFTAYARQTDSDKVIALLERYYAQVGDLAHQHGGTVKDHAGDGILILFGAPQQCDDFARRAIALARDIIAVLGGQLRASGAPLGLGVGIATGEATVGAIQGAGRLEYVAVGNVVNLAAHLCDRAADGEVLLDAETCQRATLDNAAQARQALPMKGFSEPVPVFALVASPAA